MAKKKVQKKRGSREHGRGKKAGRGAGLRGGRGNAGADGSKRIQFIKKYGKEYWGSHGFTRPPAVVEETLAINVGDLRRKLDDLEADGHVTQEGDVTVIDLEAAGYDKLLGGGKVHHAYEVRVGKTTDKATSKLEAEGGGIDLVETEADEEAEDSADEPSIE